MRFLAVPQLSTVLGQEANGCEVSTEQVRDGKAEAAVSALWQCAFKVSHCWKGEDSCSGKVWEDPVQVVSSVLGLAERWVREGC